MTIGIQIRPTQLPHVAYMDIHGNGIMSECAIMRKDNLGNIYYFEVKTMDNIDKQRLLKIVQDRNATSFELWDLMSQKTLGNGMNALNYFHQYTKILTANRQILKPNMHEIGSLSPQQIIQLAEQKKAEAYRRTQQAKTARAKEAMKDAELAAADAGMPSPFTPDTTSAVVHEHLDIETESVSPDAPRKRGRPRKDA